jgi:hypothetical protein
MTSLSHFFSVPFRAHTPARSMAVGLHHERGAVTMKTYESIWTPV